MKLKATPEQHRFLRTGLGLLALVAVWVAIQRPPDEPNYRGRSLSAWVERYRRIAYKFPNCDEAIEARHAVQTIGTNALPFLLKWMPYERPAWQIAFHEKLPNWLKNNRSVDRWLGHKAERRAENGLFGFALLGTNAASAIPELEAMLKHRSKPWLTFRLAITLTFAGQQQAKPILESALADPNQFNRMEIVNALGAMVTEDHTDTCMSIFLECFGNKDESVRNAAANALSDVAPELLPTSN